MQFYVKFKFSQHNPKKVLIKHTNINSHKYIFVLMCKKLKESNGINDSYIDFTFQN